MRVLVIGAGHGGLTAARGLAKNGHDVTVYEKNLRDESGYEWHDDANPRFLEELGLPLPPAGTYFTKREWSIIVPGSNRWLKLKQKPETLDYSFFRRPLAKVFADGAERAGAKIEFGQRVERLITDGPRVLGAAVGGKEIFCDLVIDSSGATSPFRDGLSESAGITKGKPHELFFGYRAFYEVDESAARDPEHTNRCYPKLLGKQGISWCIQDPQGTVNVLIGMTGALKKDDFDELLAALKKDNPIIGEKIALGGIFTVIPARYPATKPVADGYAAVGDAAYMTIPLIGSGIASSSKAGVMLAETVNKYGSASLEVLWRYHVRFMREIGAKHMAIDCVKRWLLSADEKLLADVFNSGMIAEEDFVTMMTGGMIKPGLKFLTGKIIPSIKNPMIAAALAPILLKSIRASVAGAKIPAEYDKKKVEAWIKKVERFFE
ncbi:MAG: NAD(P)/FAD-dependent oxidoreductase [Clostridiales bacterium]|jgi:flavin-dependent dehydrogenase|nr:NAD(P)/FAD-dependent oxidoreductase [Clostridiales bacterium]